MIYQNTCMRIDIYVTIKNFKIAYFILSTSWSAIKIFKCLDWTMFYDFIRNGSM